MDKQKLISKGIDLVLQIKDVQSNLIEFSKFCEHYSKPEKLHLAVLALEEAHSHFVDYLSSRKDRANHKKKANQ